MIKRGIVAGFFIMSSFLLLGQNFNKNDFFEADMALVTGNYEKAQKIYERLLKSDPDNANLNFLNGLCLINIPGRKKESLPFLEKAEPRASVEYKYGDPQETNSPLEAIKYYGLSKKINEDLPGAIELLNRYKSLLSSKEKDEIASVDKLITSCYDALQLMENPVYYISSFPGDNLKSDESQLYPVVNQDETMLFYAVLGKFDKTDIYFSQKIDGIWSVPVKITTNLGVRTESYPSSVSFDNERLYLTVKTGLSTDIYYSVFSKNRWQKMVSVGKPVNGKSSDSYAFESPDGNYLYFSSDRKGGFGGMDLYRSKKDEKGKWMKPLNLGETVNTEQNELMPVVNASDSKLFFKSEGFENVGGYDIFVSEKLNDFEWSPPVNIGYPINTPDDDMYFMPLGDGNHAYASVKSPEDSLRNEIVCLDIIPGGQSRKFTVSGQVILPEGESDYSDVSLDVYNTDNYLKILTIQPDYTTGFYNFEIDNGDYMVNFIKPGYEINTQLFDLPVTRSETTLIIDAVLNKEAPVAEVVPETVESPVMEEKLYTEGEGITPETESESMNEIEIPVPESPEPEYIPPEKETYTETYETPVEVQSGKTYTIQIMASHRKQDMTSFPDYLAVEMQKGNDEYFRYVTGKYPSIPDALNTLNASIKPLYDDAFIRPYNLNRYMSYAYESSTDVFTIQLIALKKEVNPSFLKNLSGVKMSIGNDGYYRYTIGEFDSLTNANQELKNIMEQGYSGAFIRKVSEISNY